MYRNFPFSTTSNKTGSLKESITSHIKFLIFTKKREFRSNPDIGCEIWDYEHGKLKGEKLIEFILDAVSKEKRLKDVSLLENKIEYNTQKGELLFSLVGVLENGDIIKIPLIISIILTIEHD